MIEGYNIYRNYRNQQGGGGAFYVKETMPDPIIKVKSDSLEIICLEIAPKKGKSFYVISWYRPPTNEIDISTFEKIRDIIKELKQDEKEIIIVGDTNCDFKNMSDGNSKQLQQVYSEYRLE